MGDIDINPKSLVAFADKARPHAADLGRMPQRLNVDTTAFGTIDAGPELARRLSAQGEHVRSRLAEVSAALDLLLAAATEAATMAKSSDGSAKKAMHAISKALDAADHALAGKATHR